MYADAVSRLIRKSRCHKKANHTEREASARPELSIRIKLLQHLEFMEAPRSRMEPDMHSSQVLFVTLLWGIGKSFAVRLRSMR